MSTSRRDEILSAINTDDQPDFRQIIRGIKAEAAESGGVKSRQDLVEEYKNDCSEELRTRMEGVMRRDQMGPHEGENAPDFDLKRMGSEDHVQLLSFKDKRPVALVFGSYT